MSLLDSNRKRSSGTFSTVDSLLEFSDHEKADPLQDPISVADIAQRAFRNEFSVLKRLTSSTIYRQKLLNNRPDLKVLDRYENVVPFANSLVTLDESKVLSLDNYINANRVNSPFRDDDVRTFIATQGPLPTTAASFWRMVLKYKVPLILAIVEPELLGQKCHSYFPIKRSKSTGFGAFEIFLEESFTSAFMTLRTLRITNRVSMESHSVTHAHITAWPDGSTVPKKHREEFVQLLQMLEAYFEDYTKKPIVVHCSAGIGRTCTLIGAYYLFDHWRERRKMKQEFKFSVFKLVKHLRGFRWRAVQTLEQYEFLYEMAASFISL